MSNSFDSASAPNILPSANCDTISKHCDHRIPQANCHSSAATIAIQHYSARSPPPPLPSSNQFVSQRLCAKQLLKLPVLASTRSTPYVSLSFSLNEQGSLVDVWGHQRHRAATPMACGKSSKEPHTPAPGSLWIQLLLLVNPIAQLRNCQESLPGPSLVIAKQHTK